MSPQFEVVYHLHFGELVNILFFLKSWTLSSCHEKFLSVKTKETCRNHVHVPIKSPSCSTVPLLCQHAALHAALYAAGRKRTFLGAVCFHMCSVIGLLSVNGVFAISSSDYMCCSVKETPGGKYISPFHDIPLTTESEQVNLSRQSS